MIWGFVRVVPKIRVLTLPNVFSCFFETTTLFRVAPLSYELFRVGVRPPQNLHSFFDLFQLFALVVVVFYHNPSNSHHPVFFVDSSASLLGKKRFVFSPRHAATLFLWSSREFSLQRTSPHIDEMEMAIQM